MSVKVPLQPGCGGFTMEDGTNYSARPGSSVTVSDEHAAAIRRQVGGDAGLTGHGSFRTFLGTKAGRWCPGCRRLWQAWSTSCPRCGGETIAEDEMAAGPKSGVPSACAVPF